MKYVKDALKIVKEDFGEDTIDQCRYSILLGNIMRDIGNPIKALENYKECLKILNTINSQRTEIEISLKYEIATLFSSVGFSERSIIFYCGSLRLAALELGPESLDVARGICAIGWFSRETSLSLHSIEFIRHGKLDE